MTASPADRPGRPRYRPRRRHLPGRAILLGLGLLAAAPIPAALAQAAGAPMQLFPGPATQEQPRPDQPRVLREGVEAVGGLSAPSADSVGLIDQRQGGLPAEMWKGSSYRIAVRALQAVPAAARSPARRELARRLMASIAVPPPGGADSALLGVRASKLLAMGATADVRALVDGLPEAARSEALARLAVDALLIDALTDQACATAEQGVSRYESDYWLKVMVYCGLRAGQRDQAALQLTMVREQGSDDALFLWAAEQMSGLRPKMPAGFPNPTPLTVAMLRDLNRALPAAAVHAEAPAWLLRAVAMGGGKGVDPLLRAGAAELALIAGALSTEEAAAALAAVPATEADLARSPEALTKDRSVRGAAVLYQATLRQENPVARAEAAAAALEDAAARGVMLAAAHLYAPLVQTITPEPALGWFALPAARMLYATGRFEAAQKWSAMVGALVATGVQTGQPIAARLWALDRLAGERTPGPLPGDRLNAWRTAASQGSSVEVVARQESRLLALLQATGDQVGQDGWSGLWGVLDGDPGRIPAAPFGQGLMDAVIHNRVGETAALALAVFGNAPSGGVADSVLADTVDALRRVGLGGFARGIAVEAAVAAGL